MARKKRESRKGRRNRQKRQKRLLRDLRSSVDPNHLRFEVDETEFGILFILENGQDCLGNAKVNAKNRFGQPAGIRFGGEDGVAVGSKILGLDRGKAGRMVSQWKDAETVAEIRARLKEKRAQQRIDVLDSAVMKNKVGWYRHAEGNRSVLIGTHNGVDPEHGSDGVITTFKNDAGRYGIAREFWNGDYSQDGVRKGVVLDRLPVSFRTAREAHRAFYGAIDSGETLNFESGFSENYAEIRSHKRVSNMAESLEVWKRKAGDNIVDMKQVYNR